jgi:hypothetical protein
MKTINELAIEMAEILDDLDVYYPSTKVLELEIKSAIGAINRCRRFTPSGDKLYDENYEDKIVPLAIAGYEKTGAEGEIAHSENNVNRSYGSDGKYPKSMLIDIVPLAKFK